MLPIYEQIRVTTQLRHTYHHRRYGPLLQPQIAAAAARSPQPQHDGGIDATAIVQQQQQHQSTTTMAANRATPPAVSNDHGLQRATAAQRC